MEETLQNKKEKLVKMNKEYDEAINEETKLIEEHIHYIQELHNLQNTNFFNFLFNKSSIKTKICNNELLLQKTRENIDIIQKNILILENDILWKILCLEHLL
jgi:hypothetical protein